MKELDFFLKMKGFEKLWNEPQINEFVAVDSQSEKYLIRNPIVKQTSRFGPANNSSIYFDMIFILYSVKSVSANSEHWTICHATNE